MRRMQAAEELRAARAYTLGKALVMKGDDLMVQEHVRVLAEFAHPEVDAHDG